MMAEVMLSPSSSWINHQRNHHRHQNHGSSVFRATNFSSGSTGFPSLKLSPLSLRRSPFSSSSSSYSSSSSSSSFNSDFHGRRFLLPGFDHGIPNPKKSSYSVTAQMSIGIIGKAQKWWEKGIQPNMKEVKGAQDLVDSLFNAGDKLVIVDFFSPSCGGCRALHPKICQLAEMNPDVQFLQVNYEEHKSMCYSLNVHVLPFFRFYRGAHGRLCSFSCTNATIKKFKDALAKHSPDRCSLGPPKGLEGKELLALASNKDLCFNYTPKPEQPMPVPAREEILLETAPVPASHSEVGPPISLPLPLPLFSTTSSNAAHNAGDKTLVASGR